MEQVEHFKSGTRDYADIKGSTGPCVYPAGHLYLFSILHSLTNQGNNILKAQLIFLVIYLINGLLVIRLYRAVLKVEPYVLILLFLTSYRVHSIFILRLFNDVIAVTLFHCSLLLMVHRRWSLASLFFRSVLPLYAFLVMFFSVLLCLLRWTFYYLLLDSWLFCWKTFLWFRSSNVYWSVLWFRYFYLSCC